MTTEPIIGQGPLYESFAYPETHPDRAFAFARILGGDPVHPSDARVLEVGCAGGGNLLPMAELLPTASFVGIDISPEHIGQAAAAREACELTNVKLEAVDLAEFDWDGQFDYIIVHGVYSWVAPGTRDALMRLLGRHLAPRGIAHVSYNVYPGWHLRSLTRDLVRRGTRDVSGWADKVDVGRRLLRDLGQALEGLETPYSGLVRQEARLLDKSRPSYVHGEHLCEFNEPVYFRDFVEHLHRHDLDYVADADPSLLGPGNLPPRLAAFVQRASDRIVEQEYLDYARGTFFRRSLISRRGAFQVTPGVGDRLDGLFLAGFARPVDTDATLFKVPTGKTVRVDGPARRVLEALREAWPDGVSFSELRDGGYLPVDEEERRNAGEALLGLFRGGALELRPRRLGASLRPSDSPVASRLARHYASAGTTRLPNLRHEAVLLSASEAATLALLDGRPMRSLVEHEIGSQQTLMDVLRRLGRRGFLRSVG